MNKLKIMRVMQSMSQAQLAKKTGLSQWQISMFEAGLTLPRPEHAVRICAALGVDDPIFIWPELKEEVSNSID